MKMSVGVGWRRFVARSCSTHPGSHFAEFIIGRRFAPTRWLNAIRPSPPGEGEEIDSRTNSYNT